MTTGLPAQPDQPRPDRPQPDRPQPDRPQPDHPQAATPVYAATPEAGARRRPVSTAFVLGVVAICVLSFLFLLVIGYVVLSVGPAAALICGLLALVPLTAVLLVVRLIDRWEPEPRGALWFALLWGAAASVTLALLVDAGVQLFVYAASDGQALPSDTFGAVVQAPLVEESAKGLGVLLIFLVLRRTFDGPVDGLVYAATVAGGFAFTENILYFGSSLVEGGGVSLGVTFALRGIMGPFAHVMFTACTGIALGLASRRRGFWPAAGLFLLGLFCAMLLHALWNGTTVVADGLEGFLFAYAVIQVPLFAGA
ncbi:PrsW family intramembrane metalloprotease, partial [Subtercola sp. Z020]|uniref:PrsW family glutamic-type intramembrane protease n=1 Tax=Subtercola sp. Z020 TaxID=2080582 RepID=UPI000D41A774